MNRSIGTACAFALCVVAGTAARAQVLNDGNMDALAVGNNPNTGVPAGAWGWPANYVTSAVNEPAGREGIFSIVPTNTFQVGANGNSLHLFNPQGTASDNFHLPNLFATPFQAAPGVICTVTFDLWVVSGFGGGSVYIGGDNGGGGFSNATGDRTAQLTWLSNGQLAAANNLGSNITVLPAYAFDAWMNIRIVIDTNARNYDLFYGVNGGAQTQIGNDLVFRAPNPALSVNYDRFTFVQFGATVANPNSYLDNLVVVPAPGALALLGLGGLVAGRRRR